MSQRQQRDFFQSVFICLLFSLLLQIRKKMQFTVPFVSSKQNNTQNSCSFASEVVERSDFTLL